MKLKKLFSIFYSPNTPFPLNIRVGIFTYFLLALLAALFFYKTHYYNWDIVPYTACLVNISEKNAEKLHTKTYEIAKKELPPKFFQNATDSLNPYRKKAFENPQFFQQQLIYYKIKPAFIGICWIMKGFFHEYAQAIAFVNVFSWFLLSFIILFWLWKELQNKYAILLSLLLVYQPFIIEIVRTISPDCFSSVFVLMAFACFFYQKNIACLSFLLFSCLIRPDNLIITGVMVIFMGIENFDKKTLKLLAVSLFLCFLLTILFLFLAQNKVSWNLDGSKMDFQSLISHYSEGIKTLHKSLMPIFAIFSCLFFAFPSLLSLKDRNGKIVFLLWAIIAAKFLLIPTFANRFFLPIYFFLLLLFISALNHFSQKLRQK